MMCGMWKPDAFLPHTPLLQQPGAAGKWRPGMAKAGREEPGGAADPALPRSRSHAAGGAARGGPSPTPRPAPGPLPPAPSCPIVARWRRGRWCGWRPALRWSRCCPRGAGGRAGGCGRSATVPARLARTVSARGGRSCRLSRRAGVLPGAAGSSPGCCGARPPCPGCSRQLRRARLWG